MDRVRLRRATKAVEAAVQCPRVDYPVRFELLILYSLMGCSLNHLIHLLVISSYFLGSAAGGDSVIVGTDARLAQVRGLSDLMTLHLFGGCMGRYSNGSS